MNLKLLTLLAALTAAGWCAAAEVAGAGFRLVADGNRILIVDASDNAPVFELGGVDFSWSPEVAQVAQVTAEGERALRADYAIANDPEGRSSGYAVFSVDGNRVDADYVLQVPDSVNYGGMMAFRLPLRGEPGELYKSGIWTRHDHGGVPYERPGVILRPFDTGNLTVWEQVDGNPMWASNWSAHADFQPTGQPGEIHARVRYVLTPATQSPTVVAAGLNGEAVGLVFVSDQPSQVWGTGEAPKLALQAANPGAAALDAGSLAVTVRDFDGGVVWSDTVELNLAPLEERTIPLAIPASADQEIYFLEAAATADGRECFTRTNIAFLEDYLFSRNPDSIFGISAAFFDLPDRDTVYRLLKRIGVTYLRSGDNRESSRYGITSFFHDHYTPDEWRQLDAAGREAMLREKLDRVIELGAPAWEFGNENRIETPEAGREYVEYLTELKRLIAASGADIDLLSIGFANGFDGIVSLKTIHDAGAWPLLDGIAYHLGRGNMTPDLRGGGQWNYLGSLDELNQLIAGYGAKPVYLTEVYTCTFPNNWWYDSLRRSAENVVLSYALAMAEGVRIVFFYQLHDSVWHNVGGVSDSDNEYFYGLLDRFGNPKPAVLAYQATARQLDGAEFVRYLDFPEQPTVRGILFRDAGGQSLALLWDRSEGYFQSEAGDDYAADEPWVDPWHTVTEVVVPAANGLTVIDAIGRASAVPAAGGRAVLELTGAPVWVRGGNFQ